MIPGSKVHDGLETEELENRETNEDCVVIVPKMNKEKDAILYMMATKPLHRLVSFKGVVTP